MLRILRELLNSQERTDPPSPEDRVRVATCILLLEVARADDEFSPGEWQQVVEGLRRRFSLDEEDARALIALAGEARRDSQDLFRFTNTLNEGCTVEDKVSILEEIWRVVYADGVLEAHEDHLVHKFARLLNLSHPVLIAAKLRVRDEARRAPGEPA